MGADGPARRSVELTRIGVGSAASVGGALYAALGAIGAVLALGLSVVSEGAVGSGWAMLAVPLYGIVGALLGGSLALVYNGVAATLGGVELELRHPGDLP